MAPDASERVAKWDEEWATNGEASRTNLKAAHDNLVKATKAFHDAQTNCQKQLKSHTKLMKELNFDLKKLRSSGEVDEPDWASRRKKILENESLMKNVKFTLPMDISLPLKLLLGNVNLTLPHVKQRWQYKEDYEKFKLHCTYGIIVGALLCVYFSSTLMNTLFYVFLGWYYGSVTIRELILKANGSNIKLWWLFHHYSSIVVSAVLLLWSHTPACLEFEYYFKIFSIYQGIVQVMQYRYQSATLYKKRALGESQLLDTTTDLPNRWTLSFLVGFLTLAYLFQLFNSFKLSMIYMRTGEWEAVILAVLQFVMGVGNTCITSLVVFRKFFPDSQSAAWVSRLLNKNA